MNDSVLNPSANDSRLLKHRRSSALNYNDVDIIRMFESEGCEVQEITREIVNSGTRRRVYKVVRYIASCGHPASIRLGKFLGGQGRKCSYCRFARGSAHHAYNPNLTDEERIVNRDTAENALWRKAVYERDGYTCQVCKDAEGGNLEAHHLNSYADYPDERYDITNGITLCRSCHRAFHHAYTYHHNTREQFESWLRQDNTEVSAETKELATP